MHLAGIPVRDELILELARMVDDPELADRLESAYGREVKVLGLDIPERETIIRALEDPPPGARGTPRGAAPRARVAVARGPVVSRSGPDDSVDVRSRRAPSCSRGDDTSERTSRAPLVQPCPRNRRAGIGVGPDLGVRGQPGDSTPLRVLRVTTALARIARVKRVRIGASRFDVLPVALDSAVWRLTIVLAREGADRIGVRRGTRRLAVSGHLTGERGTSTHARYSGHAGRNGQDSPHTIYLPCSATPPGASREPTLLRWRRVVNRSGCKPEIFHRADSGHSRRGLRKNALCNRLHP